MPGQLGLDGTQRSKCFQLGKSPSSTEPKNSCMVLPFHMLTFVANCVFVRGTHLHEKNGTERPIMFSSFRKNVCYFSDTFCTESALELPMKSRASLE